MPFLYAILSWFTRYFVLKILALFAVGLFTYSVVQFFFEKYINTGLQMLGGIPADAWSLIAIAKLDKALSIILGAWAIRAAIATFKTIITKLG